MSDKDFNVVKGFSWKVKYTFETFIEVIEESNNKINILEQKLNDALNVKKFQSYKEYQYKTLKTWGARAASSWYDSEAKPLFTIEQLEELRKADLLVAAENKIIVEQNKISHKIVKDYLTRLGLKPTKRVYKSKRSLNSREITCEWVNEIAALFPGCSLENDVNVYYDKEIKRIQEYFKKIEDEKEAKARVAAQDKKIRERDAFLVRMVDKYKLLFLDVPSPDDVIDELIKENKYLMLGHYLLKNREDWNDGPRFAEYGLSQFKAESSEDLLIYHDIYERIHEWGGDGRTFRDSQYGYDYLFSLAAKQNQTLYDDFMKVRDYAT